MSGLRKGRRDQEAQQPRRTALGFAQGRLDYTRQARRRRRNRRYLLLATLHSYVLKADNRESQRRWMPAALLTVALLSRVAAGGSGIVKNKSKFAVVIALALSLSAVAQQPRSAPAGATPPTFPPDTSAPKPTHRADPEQSTLPLTSQELKIRIVKKLQTEPGLNSRNIHVKVNRDTVLLRGSLSTADERTAAERIAKTSSGNLRVENRLAVDR